MKPGCFDIVVTTYEAIIILFPELRKIKWGYVVFDEAHKLKNSESQISLKSRLIDSKHRLLLTGTPLHNNLLELWALLNFLMPTLFKSSSDFDQWFDFASNKPANQYEKQKQEKSNFEMIQKLHQILRPFMLRRTKKDLET